MTDRPYTQVPDVAADITNRCNLHCTHCYNCSGEGPAQDLPLGQLCDLFDEIVQYKQQHIRLGGGDPVLHPEFPQVVREAADRGIEVSLSTSGLFDSGAREALPDLPIALYVVSLDGLRDQNDRIRGNGSFERAVDFIRFLRGAGRKVTIATHVCKSNAGELPDLVALADELGAGIKFAPVRPVGRARQLMADEILTASALLQAVRTVDRLRSGYPSLPLKIDFDVLRAPPAAKEPPPRVKQACPAGRSRLNVCYDGYIYPCSFFVTRDRRFAIGRLGKKSLLELWQDSPVLSPFRELVPDPHCLDCGAFGRKCFGGCRAMAYFSSGRLDARDPLCIMHLAKANGADVDLDSLQPRNGGNGSC